MRKQVIMLTLVLAASAVASAATDLTGKWVAETPGFDGNNSTMVFRLKQSGETLSGTVNSLRSEETISEGKVTGNSVAFTTVERLLPGVEVKTIYKGTSTDNEFRFTRTQEGVSNEVPGANRGGARRGGRGGPTEMVAKKVN